MTKPTSTARAPRVIKTKPADTSLEITMNKEHLSQSLQQYFRQYGYLKEDGQYYEVDNVVFLSNDGVKVSGRVMTDGSN